MSYIVSLFVTYLEEVQIDGRVSRIYEVGLVGGEDAKSVIL
jgi:hypothetical protein